MQRVLGREKKRWGGGNTLAFTIIYHYLAEYFAKLYNYVPIMIVIREIMEMRAGYIERIILQREHYSGKYTLHSKKKRKKLFCV